MDAGHEGMTGRPTAFGMNCEMTSACWILFHAESQTKQNKPEVPRCLHYSTCASKGPSKHCVSMMTWRKYFTREIVECPPTPNRRLPRTRITTTELLPILATFLDGI